MKTWAKIALVAVLVLVALAAISFRVAGRCPLQLRPTTAPVLETPASAPSPAAAPASAPSRTDPQQRKQPAAAQPRPLDEKQFIEISSTILMQVAQVQDRPDAQELLAPLMAAVLRKAGVSEEEFAATAEKIYADHARSQRVGDAILDRVEQRSTPQMRLRVASLAEAMRLMQQAGTHRPQRPPSGP